jgi:RNA-directed DNA polymerase
VLTSLHHLIDREWMLEAYRLTRKDGAPGIDGVTATDYEATLEANLDDLLARIKSGRYIAPPVRRHYIPKADGTQRPLGIPTLEDKVAQRAILLLLEPIYETDFLSCSYGFRPGRSAHDALHALRNGFMEHGLRWVVDVDISKYFDTIDHAHLRQFLDQRVTDGVVRRMIDKWLKAGVFEKGTLRRTTDGTPQGGVISPLLANIYLHYVLDEWFEYVARPRLKGRCQLVRYADDGVPRTHRRKEVRNCVRDGGRPSGAGRQGQASNHCKLRRSKAGVVSVAEKAGLDPVRYGSERRA